LGRQFNESNFRRVTRPVAFQRLLGSLRR
jgi:hypothetical protein